MCSGTLDKCAAMRYIIGMTTTHTPHAPTIDEVRELIAEWQRLATETQAAKMASIAGFAPREIQDATAAARKAAQAAVIAHADATGQTAEAVLAEALR